MLLTSLKFSLHELIGARCISEIILVLKKTGGLIKSFIKKLTEYSREDGQMIFFVY